MESRVIVKIKTLYNICMDFSFQLNFALGLSLTNFLLSWKLVLLRIKIPNLFFVFEFLHSTTCDPSNPRVHWSQTLKLFWIKH